MAFCLTNLCVEITNKPRGIEKERVKENLDDEKEWHQVEIFSIFFPFGNRRREREREKDERMSII